MSVRWVQAYEHKQADNIQQRIEVLESAGFSVIINSVMSLNLYVGGPREVVPLLGVYHSRCTANPETLNPKPKP